MGQGSGLRRIFSPRLFRHSARDRASLFGFLLFFLLGARWIVDDLLAGNAINDRACGGLQFLIGGAFQVAHGGAIVVVEVRGKISWIAQIVVVLVELVGYTAETVEPFYTLDDLCFYHIAYAVR